MKPTINRIAEPSRCDKQLRESAYPDSSLALRETPTEIVANGTPIDIQLEHPLSPTDRDQAKERPEFDDDEAIVTLGISWSPRSHYGAYAFDILGHSTFKPRRRRSGNERETLLVGFLDVLKTEIPFGRVTFFIGNSGAVQDLSGRAWEDMKQSDFAGSDGEYLRNKEFYELLNQERMRRSVEFEFTDPRYDRTLKNLNKAAHAALRHGGRDVYRRQWTSYRGNGRRPSSTRGARS